MSRNRRREGLKRRGQSYRSNQPRRQFRQRLLRWFYISIVGLVGLLIILGLALPSVLPFDGPGENRPEAAPGTQIFDQGRGHIAPGQDHVAYNTSPPTSGPHYPTTALWGLHTIPIIEELQVHNLEHGGVLVQYNTDDPTLRDQLESLVMNQRNYPCYLVVAPYSDMDETIALTGWAVLQYLDAYNEQAIIDFIDAYRNKGPERVPCDPSDANMIDMSGS